MPDTENDIDISHLEQPQMAALESGSRHYHKTTAETYADEAAKIIAEASGPIEVSVEDNKRVLRKIDLFVCLPMCIIHRLQQLDKSTMLYAGEYL
jgi:hypothetical protein